MPNRKIISKINISSQFLFDLFIRSNSVHAPSQKKIMRTTKAHLFRNLLITVRAVFFHIQNRIKIKLSIDEDRKRNKKN